MLIYLLLQVQFAELWRWHLWGRHVDRAELWVDQRQLANRYCDRALRPLLVSMLATSITNPGAATPLRGRKHEQWVWLTEKIPFLFFRFNLFSLFFCGSSGFGSSFISSRTPSAQDAGVLGPCWSYWTSGTSQCNLTQCLWGFHFFCLSEQQVKRGSWDPEGFHIRSWSHKDRLWFRLKSFSPSRLVASDLRVNCNLIISLNSLDAPVKL